MPDGVKAVGAEKRTLHISGWFCTRQFVYDFQNGATGERAKAVGFTRVVCEGLKTWSGEL